MTKRSKHPRYDDPTAFSKRFPRIEARGSGGTLLGKAGADERSYKMGPIHATITAPSAQPFVPGYIMSVHGRDRYPTWDEVVWLRYNLLPDAARMGMILPNLNNYINQEGTAFRYVFTMEQTGWALDPAPTCPACGRELDLTEIAGTLGGYACTCGAAGTIDLAIWNEQHGNGFLAKEKE